MTNYNQLIAQINQKYTNPRNNTWSIYSNYSNNGKTHLVKVGDKFANYSFVFETNKDTNITAFVFGRSEKRLSTICNLLGRPKKLSEIYSINVINKFITSQPL
jgi:hypothetical protein